MDMLLFLGERRANVGETDQPISMIQEMPDSFGVSVFGKMLNLAYRANLQAIFLDKFPGDGDGVLFRYFHTRMLLTWKSRRCPGVAGFARGFGAGGR